MKKSCYRNQIYRNEIPETETTPHVTFEYKPLTCIQYAQYEKKITPAKEDKEKITEIAIDIICSQVVSWDIKKEENGQELDVKITQEELKWIDPITVNMISVSIMNNFKLIETPKPQLLEAIRILNRTVENMKASGATVNELDQAEIDLVVRGILVDNPTQDELIKN